MKHGDDRRQKGVKPVTHGTRSNLCIWHPILRSSRILLEDIVILNILTFLLTFRTLIGNSRAVARLVTVPYTVSPTFRTLENKIIGRNYRQKIIEEKTKSNLQTWTSCASPRPSLPPSPSKRLSIHKRIEFNITLLQMITSFDKVDNDLQHNNSYTL